MIKGMSQFVFKDVFPTLFAGIIIATLLVVADKAVSCARDAGLFASSVSEAGR